jgi:hypothetical protein
MRSRLLRKPSPSVAIAFVALLLALGGTAYAGSTLQKNSVGPKQIKNGAVTSTKIARGAVGTANLKSGAVTSSKINMSGLTVPNASTATTATNATHADNATRATNADNATHSTNADNATHATTATNATHATTADNSTNATNATTAENATALAKVTYVQSASITSPAGGGTVNNPSDTPGSVTCPTGTSAVGGGFTSSGAGVEINESQPTFGAGVTKPATGWNGFIDNYTATARTFTVWAICTPASAGGTSP